MYSELSFTKTNPKKLCTFESEKYGSLLDTVYIFTKNSQPFEIKQNDKKLRTKKGTKKKR